jgi:rubrerythrin
MDLMLDAIGRPTTKLFDAQPSDKRIGFLYTDGTVYTMASSSDAPDVGRMNLFGVIDKSDVRFTYVDLDDTVEDRTETIVMLLGSFARDLTKEQTMNFYRRFGIGWYAEDALRDVPEIRAKFARGDRGTARHFASILLLLLQQRHVTITDHPAHRRMSRGKSRAFMAHSTVTINLEDEVTIRRAFETGDRGAPRRHEVRTHYAHRHGDKACEHLWARVEDAENEQWRCGVCGRLRYLVRDHLRGDGSKGFVTKTYNITTKDTRK